MASFFHAIYLLEPARNRRFRVRGICQFDVLNPCWDGRPDDVPGKHWGGGDACPACAAEANKNTDGECL